MGEYHIDINCDVGEGVGNESYLFPLISSCNIACGGHAGSSESMAECLQLAKQYNVKVGAHPSYPDAENFGRLSMDISEDALIEAITEQIDSFLQQCEMNSIAIHHIKPHGALYNDIAKDSKLASLFLKIIAKYKEQIFLYVPYNSVVAKMATKNGFKIKVEAFADRNYNDDGSLVSRKEKNAVIMDEAEVLAHTLTMIKKHVVKTINGKRIPIYADTFCVHGDTPSALEILTYLSIQFPRYKIHYTT